jgi:hypothetical protein
LVDLQVGTARVDDLVEGYDLGGGNTILVANGEAVIAFLDSVVLAAAGGGTLGSVLLGGHGGLFGAGASLLGTVGNRELVLLFHGGSINAALARSKSNTVAISIKDGHVVFQELLAKNIETASVLASNVRKALISVRRAPIRSLENKTEKWDVHLGCKQVGTPTCHDGTVYCLGVSGYGLPLMVKVISGRELRDLQGTSHMPAALLYFAPLISL